MLYTTEIKMNCFVAEIQFHSYFISILVFNWLIIGVYTATLSSSGTFIFTKTDKPGIHYYYKLASLSRFQNRRSRIRLKFCFTNVASLSKPTLIYSALTYYQNFDANFRQKFVFLVKTIFPLS